MEEHLDVHTEHCCSKHGCKYGYDIGLDERKCSVASGEKKQSYPCEYCNEDLEDVGVQADEILKYIYENCLGSEDFKFTPQESKRIRDWMKKFHPEEA
jgi:hypothetical protein